MKIHDKMSEELEECTDLRQGSALSPVLFSLYINDLVKRLHAEKCGVQCGDHLLPGLLFVDDTYLVASDKAGLKKSLDILRMRTVVRCELEYEVDGEVIHI